jgi:hypothetical protein
VEVLDGNNLIMNSVANFMPAKTGASHGISAFVTLIIGTIFSKFIWDVLPPIGEFSLFVTKAIRDATGLRIPVSEQFAGTIVIMFGLSFIWGVVYHIGRHS